MEKIEPLTLEEAQAADWTVSAVDVPDGDYVTQEELTARLAEYLPLDALEDYAKKEDLDNTVQYNSDDNIILRNGTQIAGAPKEGGTVHEILGINTYTDAEGTFDQVEGASKEALLNFNMLYDERTKGHATIDVYNRIDGLPVFKTKEFLVNVSDLGEYKQFVELPSKFVDGVFEGITFEEMQSLLQYANSNYLPYAQGVNFTKYEIVSASPGVTLVYAYDYITVNYATGYTELHGYIVTIQSSTVNVVVTPVEVMQPRVSEVPYQLPNSFVSPDATLNTLSDITWQQVQEAYKEFELGRNFINNIASLYGVPQFNAQSNVITAEYDFARVVNNELVRYHASITGSEAVTRGTVIPVDYDELITGVKSDIQSLDTRVTVLENDANSTDTEMSAMTLRVAAVETDKADLINGKVNPTQLPESDKQTIYGTATGYDSTTQTATGFISQETGAAVVPEEGVQYLGTTTNRMFFYIALTGLFVAVDGGVVIGESSTTAGRGDWTKAAYDHSNTTGNPHGTVIGDIPNLTLALVERALVTDLNTKVGFTDFNNALALKANSTDVANVAAQVSNKENTIIAGNTSQYWRGDKTWQILPNVPMRVKTLINTAITTTELANGAVYVLPYTITNINIQATARIALALTFQPDAAVIVLGALLNTTNISVKCDFYSGGTLMDTKYAAIQRHGLPRSVVFETVQNLDPNQQVSFQLTATYSAGSIAVRGSTTANYISIT